MKSSDIEVIAQLCLGLGTQTTDLELSRLVGEGLPGCIDVAIDLVVDVVGRERTRANWDAYYENVYRHLLGRAKLVITPESAGRVIGVLEAANLSAARGSQPVKPAFA